MRISEIACHQSDPLTSKVYDHIKTSNLYPPDLCQCRLPGLVFCPPFISLSPCWRGQPLCSLSTRFSSFSSFSPSPTSTCTNCIEDCTVSTHHHRYLSQAHLKQSFPYPVCQHACFQGRHRAVPCPRCPWSKVRNVSLNSGLIEFLYSKYPTL